MRSTGLIMTATGVVFSMLAFLASLRGIGFGIWPQSEIVTGGLHICAFMATLGLLILSRTSRLPRRVFHNPVVFIPILIGVLSLIMLPFHALPVRSFIGDVRSGEGAIWWIDIGIFTAALLILWRIRLWRRVVTATAIAAFVLCALLSFSHIQWEHYYAPLYFTDYLSFVALCFLPLGYGFCLKQRKPALWLAGGYLLLNIFLYATGNRAMIAFGIFIPLVFYGFWFVMHTYKPRLVNPLSFLLLAGIPVIIVTALYGLTLVDPRQGYYAFTGIDLLRTVASRAYLIDVSLQSMIDQPLGFMTGLGWGSYVDHLAAFQPIQWIDFTTLRGGQWDGLAFDHFHSHNMFIETLNAVGTGGLILLLAYYVAIATQSARSEKKPAILLAAGLMIWASFWFFLPLMMPFLVFAVVSTHPRNTSIRFTLPAVFYTPFLIIIAAMQLAAAIIILATAHNTHQFEPTPFDLQTTAQSCPADYVDFGGGGQHLSRLMLDRLRYTVDLATTGPDDAPDKESPATIPGHLLHLNSYFCQAGDYIATHPASKRLILAHLTMRGEILVGLDAFLDPATRAYYENGWQEELTRWITDNPMRTDMASPYLLYNVMMEREPESRPVIDHIRRQNPEDPLGLWFAGLDFLQSPDRTEQGLIMMRRALEHGIERYIPIDDTLLDLLRND